MTTAAEHLGRAESLLQDVTETPRLDAEILLAHALGLSRARLLARLSEPVEPGPFEELVERRRAHEPIAYITGEWEFFSLTFHLRPPVLVPRPETEHLVETVLEVVGDRPCRVLELCTGSGCIAVAVAAHAPRCQVVATDLVPENLGLARENAERLGVGERVEFRCGDLFEPIAKEEHFEVVCANPPYVEEGAWPKLAPVIRLHEDPRALLAGPDGLDVIRRLVSETPAHLTKGGTLAFEMGMGQYEMVTSLLKAHGYQGTETRPDLAGIERIAVARRPAHGGKPQP